ncbi:MAG: malonyl-CoA/methylmalonyl-CoA synthetase [Thermodesulfobacteriota bacterium]|nr:malonyl-CoA/methylmalonyl-CoA synthetase [Thermodesulfobacteriota bacterium]
MDFSTLWVLFEETFLRQKEKTALTFLRGSIVESRLTYGTLDKDTDRMARFLFDLGVKKGDRVILFFPKSVLSVVIHLALLKMGAIGVPLNTGFKKSEMDYFVKDAEPSLILTGVQESSLIAALGGDVKTIVLDTARPYEAMDFFRKGSETVPLPPLSPDDPALIIYTSGTTGRPKGAVLTQKNLCCDAQNIVHIWEIGEVDTLCHALPLFHVHGLCFALHTALLAGAHVLLLDAFSPETVVDILEQGDGTERPTVFMAVPSMYSRLMDVLEKRGPDLRHMRLWTSGSAPLLPKDFLRIKDLVGQEPVEREGMSETGMNFSNPIRGVRKPGSIGLPLPGLEVRIIHLETLEDVPPGETGEIWLRGPAITPGYWRKPDETAKTFVDGWFRTGDMGRIDEEGYYYLTDRLKHIIISGGENISPKEVEAVINRLDGVKESAVVGIPDERWGEKVVTAVVSLPGAALPSQTILSYCKEHLHSWKCPKEVRFIDSLPRNTMGKVLKEEVVRLFST